jgi:trimeric autotransporter adhesin
MRNRHVHATIAALTVLATLALATPAFAAPEEPVTEEATGVTGTEAMLHGQLNPNASATAGYFFDWNQGGSCEGNQTEQQGEQTGEKVSVESPLTGLEPSREYSFCVVATHQEGETLEQAVGASQTFTTAALAPAVDAQSAGALTPFSATLEAQVNPNNQATTACAFEYGLTTIYEKTVPCEPGMLEGFGDQGLTAPVTELAPGTTYHFRVVVENATGKTEGADTELATPPLEAPIVDSESTSGVSSTGARLEAQVNPNYQETTYSFEYATSEALTGATVLEGAAPIAAGFGDQLATALIPSGLTPGTTYYYRVIAQNGAGTTEGPVEHFITVGPPLLTAATVQNVTRTTAQLAGATVDPVGAATSFSYHYIDQAGYERGLSENPGNPYQDGASSLPIAELPAGYGPQPAPTATLSELVPGTTYHFALSATNSAGTTIGTDGTFTTLPGTPPSAVTGGASGVGHHEATVSGTVDPAGLDTSWELQLGTEAGSYGPAAVGSTDATAGPTAVSVALSALPAGVTFHYRLVASSHDGTSYGSDQTFTTAGFPSLTLPSLTAPPLLAFTPLTPVAVTGPPVKALTKAQKLAKALKACRHKRKSRRAACRRAAKRRYR